MEMKAERIYFNPAFVHDETLSFVVSQSGIETKIETKSFRTFENKCPLSAGVHRALLARSTALHAFVDIAR